MAVAVTVVVAGEAEARRDGTPPRAMLLSGGSAPEDFNSRLAAVGDHAPHDLPARRLSEDVQVVIEDLRSRRHRRIAAAGDRVAGEVPGTSGVRAVVQIAGRGYLEHVEVAVGNDGAKHFVEPPCGQRSRWCVVVQVHRGQPRAGTPLVAGGFRVGYEPLPTWRVWEWIRDQPTSWAAMNDSGLETQVTTAQRHNGGVVVVTEPLDVAPPAETAWTSYQYVVSQLTDVSV